MEYSSYQPIEADEHQSRFSSTLNTRNPSNNSLEVDSFQAKSFSQEAGSNKPYRKTMEKITKFEKLHKRFFYIKVFAYSMTFLKLAVAIYYINTALMAKSDSEDYQSNKGSLFCLLYLIQASVFGIQSYFASRSEMELLEVENEKAILKKSAVISGVLMGILGLAVHHYGAGLLSYFFRVGVFGGIVFGFWKFINQFQEDLKNELILSYTSDVSMRMV